MTTSTKSRVKATHTETTQYVKWRKSHPMLPAKATQD
jgi:hypothetical protein